MKLLLQTDWEADNMTAPVKQAIAELAWKGEDVWRESVTLNWLQLQRDLSYKDYTPIGTVEFAQTFAEKIGIKLPLPIHATELFDVEGRWYIKDIKRETLKYAESKSSPHYPTFVKPLTELKKFTGFVARSDKDFDLYPDVDWNNTKLFCTQVIDNIVSEWRCYVLNGKVVACINYSGDPLNFPFRHVIHELIKNFTNSPVAYSLDIAIEESKTGYKTRFIEINDAWALGYYGGDIIDYTKMHTERWKQIIQNQS